MSDVGDASFGTGAQRIGDAERDAATGALIAHREAGRLDPVEFEDRQVQVSRARTWAQIEPLFADLPQPHPVGMPAPAPGALQPLRPSGPAGRFPDQVPGLRDQAEGRHPDRAEGLLGSVVPHQYKATVMSLTPFAALFLFFLTPRVGWLWFLAIPVMGILLYGPEGNQERQRQERLVRDERRRIQRDEHRLQRTQRRLERARRRDR